MIILGIETSCDETSLCLLELKEESEGQTSYRVFEHLISSQAQIHSQYGGVFPMLAKREHTQNIVPMMEALISSPKITNRLDMTHFTPNKEDKVEMKEYLKKHEPGLYDHFSKSTLNTRKIPIDRIAVTVGPGLEPALWVGVNFAKALAMLWNVPIVPVNHMEGHIVGSLIEQDQPATDFAALKTLPKTSLALLISGGHTELIKVDNSIGKSSSELTYQLLGSTRDDALGEAYDKVARMLGLPYPGGPQVSALAAKFREKTKGQSPTTQIPQFPRPMIDSKDLDFSFAGLKTAVLYYLRSQSKRDPYAPQKMRHDVFEVSEEIKQVVCFAFEEAITDVLVVKTRAAIKNTHAQALIVGGGVIANEYIRTKLTTLAKEFNIPALFPTKTVSGDNALMIALAGALMSENAALTSESFDSIKVSGHLTI